MLLDALAKQDRERIEHNAEEIAAYERHIKEQKSELSVSDCKWEKAEAAARALLLAKSGPDLWRPFGATRKSRNWV